MPLPVNLSYSHTATAPFPSVYPPLLLPDTTYAICVHLIVTAEPLDVDQCCTCALFTCSAEAVSIPTPQSTAACPRSGEPVLTA